MKNWLDKLPVTAIIIVYFYICGSLYLLTFWDIFGLDITNIVSVSDIAKAFVPPLFKLAIPLFFAIFFITLLFNFLKTKTRRPTTPESDKRITNILLIALILCLLVSAFILYYRPTTYRIWAFIPYYATAVAVLKLLQIGVLSKQIPSYEIRSFLFTFIIGVPVMCFFLGKYSAKVIYDNYKIKYVSFKNDKTYQDITAMKLLGFLGDKIIISTLDNTKIEILNQNAIDSIFLLKNK